MAVITWAHLCDHGFMDAAGKPCIIGVFRHIYVERVPTNYARASVVLHFEREPADNSLAFRFQVIRPDGGVLTEMSPPPAPIPPEMKDGFIIINFENILLPDWGPYEVQISINGKVTKTIPFTVSRRPDTGR